MGASYNQRLHAYQARRTWQVDETGLSWSDDEDGAGAYSWSDIKEVRLRFEPSRAQTSRVAMNVTHTWPEKITNIDFQGFADFKDKSEEFGDFLEAFHHAVPEDSQIKFVKGSTTGAFIANVVFSVLFTLFLIGIFYVLMVVTGFNPVIAVIKVGIILFMMPVLYKMTIKNKPESYTPDDWPSEILDV